MTLKIKSWRNFDRRYEIKQLIGVVLIWECWTCFLMCNLKFKSWIDFDKGAAKRINKMLPKDVFIDDFEAELLVSDTNFKVPKDKEVDDDLNAKQMYHRYSGKSSFWMFIVFYK